MSKVIGSVELKARATFKNGDGETLVTIYRFDDGGFGIDTGTKHTAIKYDDFMRALSAVTAEIT